MNNSHTLLNAILRHDFHSFIIKTFHTINPGTAYQFNWHIELISDYLRAVERGEIKRLIINIPPRSLKSVCISVAWPAWVLAHDPSKRIMAASYSQILSVKHSLDCKFILSSNWYKELFPKTILSKSHNQKSKFLTTENGFRFATSVGGSATGEGGDILIIDDPHNPSHIHSSKIRIKVIEWFEQTFITRLNNRDTGAIVLVMQRLHEEDLSGYLLANSSNWHHLKIPTKANKDYFYNILAHDKIKEYRYITGDELHKSVSNPDYLRKLEQEIGVSNYAAQYMQEPFPNNYSLLKLEDINFYEDMPEKFDYFIQSWDTAIKISENSDYSVCTIWGIRNKKYYFVSMVRKKLTYPDLKITIENLAYKYLPRIILIEDKASGQQIIQDLQLKNMNIKIIGVKPKLDKITRFASIIPCFQSSIVLLPKQSAHNNLILKELLTFPNSKNDDIVDSISQFLNYMKSSTTKPLGRISLL